MDRVKIAIVQMEAIVGQTENNLAKITAYSKKAAQEKAQFICFPELAVHGYSRDALEQYAEAVPGPSVNYLSQLAQQLEIGLIVGLAEKSNSNKPYITQVVLHPDGRIEKYRKTHLGKSEEPFFIAGEDFPVFDTPKAKVGVEICWDLHFPEVTTILALKGAEIIFAPHASPAIIGSRKEIWLKYIQARAYDNAVFIACCNLIGENGLGSIFGGGLLVVDPRGNVMGEDFNNAESMLVIDLPNGDINKIRSHGRESMRDSFYLEYRRPELYGQIVKKLRYQS